jgi:diacylglycerol kinase family enzyme
VDDGLLDLVVIEEKSRLRTIAQLPRLFRGTVDRAPGCTIQKISRVTIESDQPIVYHVDGEPAVGGTSLRIRVHPGALYVAV